MKWAIGLVIGLVIASIIVIASKKEAYHTYHGDIPSFFVKLFLIIIGIAVVISLAIVAIHYLK